MKELSKHKFNMLFPATSNNKKMYVARWLDKVKIGLATIVLTISSSTSVAEDIEIYTGVITNSTGVNTSIADNPDFFPNVLFILDNSTSMGETEPVLDRVITKDTDSSTDSDDECNIDLADYNPDIDYSFGDSENDPNVYIYRASNFTGRVVRPIQNQCQAFRDVVINNPSQPVLNSPLIQWGFFEREGFFSTYRWDGNLNNFDNNDDSAVECAADQGRHGHNTRNTGDRNARNPNNGVRFFNDASEFYFRFRRVGDDPYANVVSSEWVSGNYHRYLQLSRNPSSLPDSCPEAEEQATPIADFDPEAPLGTAFNPIETTLDPVANRAAFCSDQGRNFRTGRTISKNLYFQVPGANDNQILVYRCQTRLEIMQNALTNVLESQTSINAGLMRFNLNDGDLPGGGTVVSAIAPMNDDANRKALIDQINGIEFGQATPLAESLYEAYRYLNGQTIDQGRTVPGSAGTNHATFDVDFRTPVNRIRSEFQTDQRARTTNGGTRYRSPMQQQCQPTNVVLLSDGAPTNDQERNLKIREVTGSNCSGQGGCADDIAAFMQNNDIAPSASVNRNVNTYTIGLNAGQDLVDFLSNVARRGQPPSTEPNPGFFTADDVSGLESAFRSILGDVQSEEADVFSAPAVTVNSFNRLQNRDDLYYALFRPENGPRWAGNLKRYRVDASTQSILDENDLNAIDPTTGFFRDESRSFWSAEADGPIVDEGGAAGRQSFARRLFGNVNGADVKLSVPSTASNGIDSPAVDQFLAQTVNLANNPVGIGAVGATNDVLEDNQKRIAAWTLGLDVDAPPGAQGLLENNTYIGDSLHSTPYVLSFGSSINSPEDVIFLTSNQGLLHAIDGETGDELWSYVVDSSLFPNLGGYYNDQGFDKIYGLDAEIAFDITRNPATPEEIDGAALFFGQRRGGRKVFSVDVTNARDTGAAFPVSRRWIINGGVGDFARLGQTWAEPVVADVNYCDNNDGCGETNVGRPVVFISGGYDEFYDDVSNNLRDVRDGDVLGNALYMVDANTGQLLWMAGSEVVDTNRDLQIPEMIHSFVSRPAVLDADGNGFADTIFITDIAGQVFRIDFRTSSLDLDDISSGNNAGSKEVNIGNDVINIDNVSGGRIADFRDRSENRRFYNPQNIALLPQERDGEGNILANRRYTIATGSGYRAHPLDNETFGNRLFVIFDENVSFPLTDEEISPSLDADQVPEPVYTYLNNNSDIIEFDDLADLRIEGGLTDNDQARLTGTIPATIGYSVALPRGAEKILNEGLIADFAILFTTYTPSVNNANNLAETCEAGLGQSVFYILDLLPGGGLRAAEVLDNPGIAPTPVIVLTVDPDGAPDGADPTTGGVDPIDDSRLPLSPPRETLEPIIIVGTEPIRNREDVPPTPPICVTNPNAAECTDPPKTCDDGIFRKVCPPPLGKAIKSTWIEENRAQ